MTEQTGSSVRRAPKQECLLCGRVQFVLPDGRGFPPDIAKRRLIKRCRAAGCECQPRYTAGLALGPVQIVEGEGPND